MQTLTAELQQLCFSFLEAEEAQLVWSKVLLRELGGGELLFARGDQSDEIYFLLSGKVAVQHSTGFGDRMQVVALLDPGAIVGESGLLLDSRRGATVVATKPSRLAVLTSTQFTALAQTTPHLGQKILMYLLSRATIRLQKSSERLARVL